MNDYELVYLAQENIEEAKDMLYIKYKNYIYNLARKMCNQYNFNTIDLDDVMLECDLVFENSIYNYNQDKDSRFFNYLKICLNTKLIDIIRSNLRKKYIIDNNVKCFDDEIKGVKLEEILFDSKDLVENRYFDINNFVNSISNKVSKFEYKVLKLLLSGKNQDDISNILNISKKKVYNTIYRLKIKIKEELS